MRLDVVRGDVLELEVEISYENGTPFDLTEAVVFFTVKQQLNDPDEKAVISKVITEHSNPTRGKTYVYCSAEETDRLIPETTYYFDVQIVKGGKVYTPIIGQIYPRYDVTRRRNP